MAADKTHQFKRFIKFSGKDEAWHNWSKRFFAMATARVSLEELIPMDANTKQHANQNTLAYVDLILYVKMTLFLRL
jgi:maleate cis-trans isomerase